MTRKIYMVIAVLLLGACTPVPPPFRENILANKTYVYLFFSTEKECMENQPDPDFFINCHQQVDFYKNNIVEIMLTDIIWRGTYKIEGNIVILSFESSYEIPDGEIIFEIINPAKLLLTENGTVWKKVSGNSIWH
ncbi:hypothetical protein FK178_04615 [Antarcticibacterium arcticum]|uniref:Lipoprotein n=1 Tax=Antarcticibacterium arcticum TaxID=2585771 RepID=A0A5B8YGY9_9FLAO|nr:hypothetical protein [Antarcticibacterium arcticum]QED37034.1 hypothetical protein FK178_04615 [Antarcticibacterium arcticum]